MLVTLVSQDRGRHAGLQHVGLCMWCGDACIAVHQHYACEVNSKDLGAGCTLA